MQKQRNFRLACWWGAGLSLLLANEAAATNGDQMLGVNATQWGMAGAVTAAPQDAGTVLTNPAGLALLQLNEFRADMGFGFLNPPREANGVDSDSDLYMMPAGALAFAVNDRVTIGMGMAGMSGMGVDFDDIAAAAPGNQNVVTTKQFFKIAPGLAYRVNDRLAVGAALNIDYQSLAMDIGAMGLHLPQNQAFGFGASLGLVYAFSPRLSLGASYTSLQSMDEFKWNTTNGEVRMTMDAPPQIALGLAFEATPGLLFAADVKHIGFSEVLDEVDLKLPNGTQTLAFGWDDQVVYALAVQKRVNPKTTVRLGYNYGASPIEEEDVNSNIGSLAVTEQHVTLGLTRDLTPKVAASVSYGHAFANELEASNGTTIELSQNVVNFQISYRN